MKIEELEEIVESFQQDQNNYLSMFTSDVRKLLAVAEAAKVVCQRIRNSPPPIEALRKAMEELEKE